MKKINYIPFCLLQKYEFELAAAILCEFNLRSLPLWDFSNCVFATRFHYWPFTASVLEKIIWIILQLSGTANEITRREILILFHFTTAILCFHISTQQHQTKTTSVLLFCHVRPFILDGIKPTFPVLLITSRLTAAITYQVKKLIVKFLICTSIFRTFNLMKTLWIIDFIHVLTLILFFFLLI